MGTLTRFRPRRSGDERQAGTHDWPAAGGSREIAFGGKLLDRKRDRIARNLERLRQVTARRKPLPRRKTPFRNERSQLARKLMRQRLIAAGRQLKHSGQ